MRKLRVSLVFAALLLVLGSLAACSDRQSTWDQIQSTGVLRVGLDPTYPPFEAFDGTSLYGIDVDLAEAIAAEKALVVEFSHFGFDGLYDALATRQVDVLISALPQDVTRTRDFAYSHGYVESGLVLVSLASRPYQQVEQLADRRVAVELGAAGHVEATTWQRQVPNLSVTTYPSSDEALQALAASDADVAVVDNVTYRLLDQSESGVAFSSAPLTSEPYSLVVRREDDQLLDELNDALATLRADGRLQVILDSWFAG